jgi:hypothetical protein
MNLEDSILVFFLLLLLLPLQFRDTPLALLRIVVQVKKSGLR